MVSIIGLDYQQRTRNIKILSKKYQFTTMYIKQLASIYYFDQLLVAHTLCISTSYWVHIRIYVTQSLHENKLLHQYIEMSMPLSEIFVSSPFFLHIFQAIKSKGTIPLSFGHAKIYSQIGRSMTNLLSERCLV